MEQHLDKVRVSLSGDSAEMYARFQAVLESKVDLREVQQALNDC